MEAIRRNEFMEVLYLFCRKVVMPNSLFHIETLTSQPLKVKDIQVRLRSQVIQLRLPIANGGLIWNRPVAVVIQTADGQYQTLPVQDVTCATVLALTVFCLVTFFVMQFRHKTTSQT